MAGRVCVLLVHGFTSCDRLCVVLCCSAAGGGGQE